MIWCAENKCSVSIFPTFTNADTNTCRPQSTVWGEDPICEEHTFPSVSRRAGEGGQWLCPSACRLGLVSNTDYRHRIATTAKSFLTVMQSERLIKLWMIQIWLSLGTFLHCYTDGNQFTWLREQLREFLTPNFAWGNHLLSGSCLGVYGAAPEVNFISAMAQLPQERIHPTFESFCSPQTDVCWLQSLCRSQ